MANGCKVLSLDHGIKLVILNANMNQFMLCFVIDLKK
jgi:hypothetical protein